MGYLVLDRALEHQLPVGEGGGGAVAVGRRRRRWRLKRQLKRRRRGELGGADVGRPVRVEAAAVVRRRQGRLLGHDGGHWVHLVGAVAVGITNLKMQHRVTIRLGESVIIMLR